MKRNFPDNLARLACLIGFACAATLSISAAGAQTAAATQQSDAPSPARRSALPRGKKLVMKDGTFHLIREYKIEGDRVHYYSVDEQQWEEMPEALVDWDATKKDAADEAARADSIVKKVHVQEMGRLAQPLDIDASLEVAEGVFLPPGEGLFVFDGKAVFPLAQSDTDSKISKKRAIERVLIPVPILPSRHVVSLEGAHSKMRVRPGQTEFYMRTADGREPDLTLVRARVHGDKRDIANVDELFKEQAASANIVKIQRWKLAPGVYRFTLGEAIGPGEYAMAEIVQDAGMSLYVWDFAIDATESTTPATPKSR
jgi:hypothetical protein